MEFVVVVAVNWMLYFFDRWDFMRIDFWELGILGLLRRGCFIFRSFRNFWDWNYSVFVLCVF